MRREESKKIRATSLGNVTVKQLKAFLAVVEHKKLSAAAQQMFLSLSAFSRSIQELESDLGNKLFTRSPQGVILTEFGQAFLPHAQRLLASYVDAQSSMEGWRNSRQGKVTVAGCASVLHVAMPKLVQQFQAEFEHPTLQFRIGSSAFAVSQLLDGKAEIGVCSLTDNQSNLRCIPLLEAPIGLLIASNQTSLPTISSLAALEAFQLVRFEDDSVISQTLKKHGVRCDAYFNSPIQSCGVPGVFSLLREANMAILATGLGASHPQAKDLRFIPLPDLLPSVTVSLVTRRESAFDESQQIILDLVKDCVLATAWHESVNSIRGGASPS